MKLRRLITRRRAKRASLSATAFLLTLSFVSLWHGFAVARVGVSSTAYLRVGSGSVDITVIASWGTPPHWTLIYEPIEHDSLPLWFNWGRTRNSWAPNSSWVMVPLWPFDILLVMLTWWLWRTDQAKPWQCAKCRYDLRGLEGGVCPECGHELKPLISERVAD